jgi:hypothetical protein
MKQYRADPPSYVDEKRPVGTGGFLSGRFDPGNAREKRQGTLMNVLLGRIHIEGMPTQSNLREGRRQER